MKAKLSIITEVLNAELHGSDAECNGVSIDTRSLAACELFFAIRGERFDGHEFVEQAAERGAAGAVVSRRVATDLPQITVPDTRRALGRLGRWWRRECTARVVGVTGANGKTTVKEMLAAICRCAGPTLATRGNLNNELGVPLTLLRLEPGHRYAVVEMGANHPGEIEHLAWIAVPDVGVVTNAGAVHLEGFGSLEGAARAEGSELLASMSESSVAVINADDRFAPLWRDAAGRRRVIAFAMHTDAEVMIRPEDGAAVLLTPAGPLRFKPSLGGRHNLMNAAAAAAAALALELPASAIPRGLESVEPVAGRLRPLKGPGGCELIDDSYNANPQSLAAGVEFLLGRPGEPWLVLGEMAELGDDSKRLHKQAGQDARRAGVRRLFVMGEAARPAAEGFGEAARWFADQSELVRALRAELREGVCCLVKGSRRAAMDKVVQALLDDNDNGAWRHASGGV